MALRTNSTPSGRPKPKPPNPPPVGSGFPYVFPIVFGR